ncbi:MAG: copper amine oxidase N-terminal domain-containing protein [Firmicutes bacterium]|nr:copper amine oxidase N-terminal domain-containing protein [Bacillota bacterium]
MRPLLQALGATVNWDGATQTIIGRKENTLIQLSIPNQTLRVNSSSATPLTIGPAT